LAELAIFSQQDPGSAMARSNHIGT